MEWSQYVAGFFAGAFLANTVPHFVSGISGNRFPTPFARPPGKGLSSPTVNVVWALFNLAAGYLLWHAVHCDIGDLTFAAAVFAGVAAISIPMSVHFSQKHKE